MFVLTQLINTTLKINHIFKKSNPHFINWMAGSISNFTHIDTGVVNGVVTTVYNLLITIRGIMTKNKLELTVTFAIRTF